MMTAYERPGVYSDYTVNSILYSSSQNNVIGLVGVNANADVNTVYEIQKLSDAQTAFGSDSLLTQMCQTALANGAYKIKAIACAAQSASPANYQTAFALLKEIEDIKIVICDTLDTAVSGFLKASVVSASENKKERIGIVAALKANAVTSAAQLNSERMVMICQNPIDEDDTALSSCITTAAIAGKVANNGNPSNSFNTSVLYGMYKLCPNYSESDIETLLAGGVTVLETIAGNIEIIRLVTTKTTTNSQSDKTFHDLNTVLIIDDVIPSIRKRLAPLIGTVKNNSKTLNAIGTQVTVELENKKKAELINSYSQPDVYLSNEDRSVCVVEVEFVVARGINRIVVSAVISV